MEERVKTSATESVLCEQYILIIECEGHITVAYETKIFRREAYTSVNELDQVITLENESRFVLNGRYTAIRTWKQRVFLLSEALDYACYCRYTIAKEWQK